MCMVSRDTECQEFPCHDGDKVEIGGIQSNIFKVEWRELKPRFVLYSMAQILFI